MPKGTHLSKERKQLIFSHFSSGKTPEECHEFLFLGSNNVCTLKHIKKLYGLFRNPIKVDDKIDYLADTNCRGAKRVSSHEQWYDGLVESINNKHKTVKRAVVRQHLEDLIGDTSLNPLPSVNSVGRSLIRLNAKRKRCTYYSDCQDAVQVFDFMDRMKAIDTDYIVNIDETSAKSSKFRPIYGRGVGEVIVKEWHIGNKTYSAIAAMTTLGFLPCTKVYEVACESATIQHFLTGLELYLLPTSLGLLDNASVNTCEESLQAVNRVFDGRWARNAPYSPRLAPIERGFSLVWNLVRERWEEAQQDPIRVLLECFKYYEVGSPGGSTCSAFFNVYRRNRGETTV